MPFVMSTAVVYWQHRRSDRTLGFEMSMLNLSKGQIRDGRKLAAYVATLPPAAIWELLKAQINPEDRGWQEKIWKWLGRYLDAYFSGKSDPTSSFEELTELGQKNIRIRGNHYLQLSILIFEAERFIKSEAHKQKIPYSFKSRQELLQQLILEDCFYDLMVLTADFWETPSEKNLEHSARQLPYLMMGNVIDTKRGKVVPIEKADLNKVFAVFDKEDSRLERQVDIAPEKLCFWTNFCHQVFVAKQKELPNFQVYLDSQSAFCKFWFGKDASAKWQKHFYKQGQRIEYQGRGKAKGTKVIKAP